MAKCYFALNKLHESISYFEQSIDLYPYLDLIYDFIFICYQKINYNIEYYSRIILFYSKKILDLINNEQRIDDGDYKEGVKKIIRDLSDQYNNKEAKELLQSIE